MITTENWNTTFYQNEHLKAFISLGADWDKEQNTAQELYFITLRENDENDLFQRRCEDLQQAIRQINSTYQDWSHHQLPNEAGEGGCGSCSAH